MATVPLAPAPPPPSRSPAPHLPPRSFAQTSAAGGDVGQAGWDQWEGGDSLGREGEGRGGEGRGGEGRGGEGRGGEGRERNTRLWHRNVMHCSMGMRPNIGKPQVWERAPTHCTSWHTCIYV